MITIPDITGPIIGNLSRSSLRLNKRRLNTAFHLGIKERREFDTLSEDSASHQTLERVRSIVRYARENIPYYTDIMRDFSSDFPSSIAEYRSLTPLGKDDIRAAKKRIITSDQPQSNLIRDATGGSTGQPLTVYLSLDDVGWRLSGHHFYQSLLGCPYGSRIASLYGGELEVTASPSHWSRLQDWLSNYARHGCFRMDESYLLQVNESLFRFQPDMIIAYASAIYMLARTLEENGIRPSYPRRVILTGAEKLEDFQREVVTRVFKKPVIERYGSREVGLMAYQLPRADRSF